MGDVMDRAMIEDTVPAQEIEGTGGAIGVGLGIAGTAIGIATGETEREALAATDTMISEGTLQKGTDTVTVLAPLFETGTGIGPGHHLFGDPEETAGMIAKTTEHSRMVPLTRGLQIDTKTK